MGRVGGEQIAKDRGGATVIPCIKGAQGFFVIIGEIAAHSAAGIGTCQGGLEIGDALIFEIQG